MFTIVKKITSLSFIPSTGSWYKLTTGVGMVAISLALEAHVIIEQTNGCEFALICLWVHFRPLVQELISYPKYGGMHIIPSQEVLVQTLQEDPVQTVPAQLHIPVSKSHVPPFRHTGQTFGTLPQLISVPFKSITNTATESICKRNHHLKTVCHPKMYH